MRDDTETTGHGGREKTTKRNQRKLNTDKKYVRRETCGEPVDNPPP